ncbi:carboxypeptidase-like regulatory domain-containing protein [Hymenobacter latericus]|uniref:carboxypeptidase-like regulatory domain-containing protein n=1 Tax=Hymenobacter sp. YIM 151858-1 TaxID=2987688 RepID=UPI00222708BF|nr:carboxypeptidase-like regulatory domain-containing protein [Hymenobacter sp. YIM 151858-1]UYZ61247.1 carboxypeptidase-like regulatory domain-containing protein [Hymenobacter sp. YIM 151858-1]
MTRLYPFLLASLLALTAQATTTRGLSDTKPKPGAPAGKTAARPAAKAAPASRLAAAPVPIAQPAAPRVLDGYALGADGLALPGVTARVAGTMNLVVSNADGMFRLPLPADGQPVRLICSYAGLADYEVLLEPDQRVLSLEMLEDAPLSFQTKSRRFTLRRR